MDDPIKEIQEQTEKIEKILYWIAEIVSEKRWVTMLCVLWAVIFVFLNPKREYFKTLPENYKLYWVCVLGLIFILAIVLAIWTKPKEESIFSPAEKSGIKGLRPFEFEDAEIFVRLQRNDILKESLEAITYKDFRFGILCGESGCGKTSFLRAGILPRLPEKNSSYECVYIKFTERNPIDSIPEALKRNDEDFLTLLKNASESKTLVMLFDQFEQFFVHFKTQEQRKPFIDELVRWYQAALPVKILISIRADFFDKLIELQKAIDIFGNKDYL